MQRAVWSVNSNLPLASVRTMQDIYSQSMARTSFTLVMLAIAGSMALAARHHRHLRRHLLLRLAAYARDRNPPGAGAQKSELKWMFVRSALLLTASGIAIGVGTAAALMQLMKSLLFGISPLDPFTYITVPLVLAVSAALRVICLRGARRR